MSPPTTALRSLRSRPVEALRVMVSNLADRLHGIKTEQSISLEAFGLADPDRLLYVPSSWKTFKVLSRVLKPEPEDVFIDFGSGKGRVVVMMARGRRLKRVVGVEISPELTAIAATNVEAVRPKLRTRDVELVTSDVTCFEIPTDMTMAYVYSSFTGPIFEQFLQSIERQLPNFSGKRLIIALQRPTNGTPRDSALATNEDLLRSQTWLRLVDRVKMRSITGWRSQISFYSAFER